MTTKVESYHAERPVFLRCRIGVGKKQSVWRRFEGLNALKDFWRELDRSTVKRRKILGGQEENVPVCVLSYTDDKGFTQHAYVEVGEVYAFPPSAETVTCTPIGAMAVENAFYPG